MNRQFLVIDGYNLLHACGWIGDKVGPGTLEKARNQLVGTLVKHLTEPQRSRTTVVFDSDRSGLPARELPARQTVHQLLIEFAVDHEDADAHIEQLIRKHSVPKQLTVVSSDHRLHKAARARGATAIDSDVWLDSLSAGAGKSAPPDPDSESALRGKDQPVDVEFWINELEIDDLAVSDPRTSVQPRKAVRPATDSGSAETDEVREDPYREDIFPPGYADDLFEAEGPSDGDDLADPDDRPPETRAS